LAGLPIVTTNMPGCQEVVRDSWNGFVVPTHAPDQLARRILDVLNNPEGARRMAALGNETVRNKFGLRSIVRSHIELYDRLIQNPGRSVEPATAWG
jgi:glycosyltransferase involved in cell wall biosynthesis